MAQQKKQSRRFLAFALSAVSLLFAGACTKKSADGNGSAKGAPRELRIFVWSEYLMEDLVKDFEKQNNAKVYVDFYSSNEELLAKIQSSVAAGSRGYDLIVPSDYMVGNMIALKLLHALDKSKLSFLKDFEARFLNPAYDPQLSFSVPFAWGTTGVAVNTKLVKGFDPKAKFSWRDLYENPKYEGQVTLLDDVKEVLHTALLIQGKKWESATDADIRRAFDYLKAHKKAVKVFAPQPRPVLEAGECGICHVYSGDALKVQKDKPEIQYVLPVEGATVWTDNLAIPANASNLELAYAFVNKLLMAENAKRFIEEKHFASPSAAARALLSPAFQKNASIFPEGAVFQKLEYLSEKPDSLTLIDRLWTELKSM